MRGSTEPTGARRAGQDEIVSTDDQVLILVDPEDREIGYRPKADCHRGEGVLHRAFSLFVFNASGELLLQRRAANKALWPLYWSNSCCSHPGRGERMEQAVHRRLAEELRLASDLQFLFKFQYHARFRDLGSEHELCWVYAGVSDQPVRANRHEIADWRFVSPGRLERELERGPERFTPWLRLEWPRVRAALDDGLLEQLLPATEPATAWLAGEGTL